MFTIKPEYIFSDEINTQMPFQLCRYIFKIHNKSTHTSQILELITKTALLNIVVYFMFVKLFL